MSYPLSVFVLFEGRSGREYCARIGKNNEGRILRVLEAADLMLRKYGLYFHLIYNSKLI